MGVRCFFLEETETLRRFLRRYADDCLAHAGYYHDAMTPFDEVQHPARTIISLDDKAGAPPKDDPRWPTHCEYCHQPLPENTTYQVFVERIYRRTDTGELMLLRDAPPGAMWDAWWYGECSKGPDGRSIIVKCPPDGWEWLIDGPASNCTMKGDTVHRCWVRHGEPPNLTVDKNGVTCAAGAGSIQTPKWHGFLRNGELVT